MSVFYRIYLIAEKIATEIGKFDNAVITDENDIYVAHAPRPDLIGMDIKDVPGLDESPLGVEIAKATGAGLWIEYLWPNPETGENEQKRTWAIRHDGYLFGSGYYKPGAEGSMPEGN